jgi:hypothetical protein
MYNQNQQILGKKNNPILGIWSIFLLVFLVACDISSEDTPPEPAIEENTTSIFNTTPDAGLSINPASFQRLRDATSFTISQLPKNGEAKFISNGFVFYKSDGISKSDNFVIEGQTAIGTKITESIQINIVNSQAELPCSAGCIGDNGKVELEKSVEIDVTRNDKTCSSLTANSLKIEIPPKNGTVEILNQKIVYKPNSDFLGEDIFFYRVGINNTKNPVAPVEITVSESADCVAGINDDSINLISYRLGSDLVIDAMQNDKLCSLYQNATLKIFKNPNTGTARIAKINNKDVIIYSTTKALTNAETFEYALYRSEKLYIKAKVTIAM